MERKKRRRGIAGGWEGRERGISHKKNLATHVVDSRKFKGKLNERTDSGTVASSGASEHRSVGSVAKGVVHDVFVTMANKRKQGGEGGRGTSAKV